MSEPETESDRPRKMAQLGRRQYEGIGPVTNDGMPIILRSVKDKKSAHFLSLASRAPAMLTIFYIFLFVFS